MSVLLLKVTKTFCNPLWWMHECVCGINFIFEIEVLCSIACWLRSEPPLKVCINCISWMMTRCSEKHWGSFQRKLGWTTYNSWLAFWQSFKEFYWPNRDEKMYKKVWSDISVYNTINREEIGSSKSSLVHSVVYQRRLWTPNLFPVDGVVHRNIGSDFFVHLFVSLWSIKFFKIKENCLHHCHSHKSLTIGIEDEPQSYLYETFPFSSSSPLKRALKIIIDGFQYSIFFYRFFKTYRRSQWNKYFLWCDKKYFHSMMVWIAWEPPLYTPSTSHSRWTRNQRATSMIFGTSTQNTRMKKRKPQKQGLTGLDFEINVKNCQKMNKMLKIVKIDHLQWAAVQKRAWWEADFFTSFQW